MTEFKHLTFDELCDKLCENKRTLIIYHVRSDADAVGSAFSLRKLLTLMGIPALCACADEVPERLRFISDDAQGSVLLDEDIDIDHERVISVDSASPAQLGKLFDTLKKDVDIMIDHHAMGTVYADCYIESDSSATAEIIYAIAKELVKRGKIEYIPVNVLGYIYAGISSDTGGFRFSNTTPRTHRIAAELLEAGVDGAAINHLLFSSKSAKQIKAEGEASRRINYYCQKTVAIASVPYSAIYSLGLDEESMETVIEVPRSINGVKIAVAIRQPTSENKFRVSMRSVGEIDVSLICAVFGGGGHKRAAGCTVEANGIDDAEHLIVREIKNSLANV
ncbi:MAG: bifunctional oligoribonuclease/PAP phosphatase NrnA [Clostridia bacterium]|nr:bifunctional oligoribonuclease/PAP phosphatase NrnA [Clostridia bacterium]